MQRRAWRHLRSIGFRSGRSRFTGWRRIGSLVSFAAALLAVLTPCVVLAAPLDLNGSDWEGYAEFVRLARAELDSTHVVTTTRIDFRELRPDDAVVLIHPERPLDTVELSKFMRAGGRVVLLDDFGTGDALLRHFNMERVPGPSQPVEYLRQNPQLALAEPASTHPVVNDVSRVVLNHATGIQHPDLSPVLKVRTQAGPDLVVAVAGAVGQGRLLAIGDASIAMNAMLRYSGNKALARGIVRYGVDSDTWGKRGGRLYVASGNFDQKGAFGGDGGALDEATRAFREALDTIRREGAPSALAYAFAVAVGLALIVWVGARAGRLHRTTRPRFVQPIPAVAQGGVAGHAAVVAAPQTSRLLAVLELKSALEEQLTAMLGLTRTPPSTELLARLESERLLDAQGLHALRQLLLRMSSVETMIVSARNGGAGKPVRDAEVVAMARTVRDLLQRARGASAHGRGANA